MNEQRAEIAEGIAEHLFGKGRFHENGMTLSSWSEGIPIRTWKFDEVVELVKHHLASALEQKEE